MEFKPVKMVANPLPSLQDYKGVPPKVCKTSWGLKFKLEESINTASKIRYISYEDKDFHGPNIVIQSLHYSKTELNLKQSHSPYNIIK